jgi:lipase
VPIQVEDRTVSVEPGLDLAVSVHRAGATALPVVLLHGLSQQRRFWGPVISRLRSGPVAAVDQRGHGDSDSGLDVDYSVPACADDVIGVLDALGWGRAVVVGHSWGASVALAAAGAHPDRLAAAVLIDGGLWSPQGMGSRSEVRERLRPPALGIPMDDIWDYFRAGGLGGTWSEEIREALAPTFVVDEAGRATTRLGMDRHMLVLDGLLEHDSRFALDACQGADVPVWAAVCEPRALADDGAAAWRDVKERAVADAAQRPNCIIHRWSGAIHDVPLQWPAMVAGFVDAAVESQEGRGR